MEFGTEIIAWGAVFTVQWLIALIAVVRQHALPRRFGDPLGSRTTTAGLLEIFSKRHWPLELRVNAVLDGRPALSSAGTVMIDRRHVYRAELYPGLYTLWQIMLARPEYLWLSRIGRQQTVLFALELLFSVVGLWLWHPLLWITAGMGLVLLLGSYIWENWYRQTLEEAVEYAEDVLDLDRLERARAAELADKLSVGVYIYPVEMLKWIWGFLSPTRRRT